MKLRNKKTGEVVDYNPTLERWNGPIKDIKYYISLAEFNEEWEDYQETKEFWFIDYDGGIIPFNRNKETATDKLMKSIGNYFETKEEAEKAVEKLKAWKRLKDKGFRFDGYEAGHNSNKELCGQAYFKAGNFWFDIKEDLHLLFGGEE